MHNKRLVSYIFDLLFVTFFLSMCFFFFPKEKEMKEIQAEIDNLSEQYTSEKISATHYFMEMSRVEKRKSEKEIVKIGVNGVVIIIYYFVLPFFFHGATLGMKWMHIRVVSNKGNSIFFPLMTRTLLLDGLLSTFLLFLAIYIINGKFYLSFVSVLVILQVLTLIINYFMIKYRRDKAGLCDCLSNSKVETFS